MASECSGRGSRFGLHGGNGPTFRARGPDGLTHCLRTRGVSDTGESNVGTCSA